MSNARNLANLLESDGDIKVAALDNAPAPTKSTIDALGIAATSLTGSQATAITNNATTAGAALPKAGGALTGAVTTNSTFDGVDIATRDSVLTSTTTTASAALPKAGGALTGAVTTNSTFDGVDIATRDGVLTSTTATAAAALPKAGGTMTGDLTVTNATATGVLSDPSGNVRAGRKNLIINGGFDVAQRGTSFTGTQIYTLDRWYMDESGSTTTLTQETHTLGQTDVPDNPKYYLKMNTTTGANNCRIEQNIEGVHNAAGQSATLSFWAKGVNPAGGNYNINMNQLFGTGGSPSTETSVSLGTFTVTSSWVKKSFTVTLASISGKTLGTNLGTDHLKLQILQPDGDGGSAAWNLNISNIQFELGSVATDFEHRSFGEEQQLCQRYFYNPLYNLGGSRGQFTLDYLVSSGNNGWITFTIPFPVAMRASSTFSHSLTPAKFLGSAAPADGADNFSFYIQNQGYSGLVGNGSIANLGGGGQYHGIVGTYYCSPSSTSASHIFIGNGCTFQFDAEL